MKKTLGILALGIFWCNASLAEEIYIACLSTMLKDRSNIENFNEGEDFGFNYFKLDSKKSEITVHEQILDDKPTKIGSKKIDYVGKNSIKFEIDRSNSSEKMIDSFILTSTNNFTSKDGYPNYTFKGTVYVKSNSDIMDYDFGGICIAPDKKPPKDKKVYKKWIKRGF